MKIPNADTAIVDIRKLTDYCLSHTHPRGQHKAKVFLSALGLTTNHAKELQNVLLQKVRCVDCSTGTADEYGARYSVDFMYVRENKKAMVRSTWIIKTGEKTPRLTSCFVL
ncbi:hypothetical protein HUU62_07075 [Rhodoferax sp. 4810]|uniref:DUF6883 domain-containing protein n=1 Tax=Thiospirillum jenense TaxID=1653858 RepID=A0A839H789_9GAMM|nr:DUF6883 domain-containing protein [Thiospirillum jenense]MBB1074176.1 hypothetical protein [Rhodoferax jenense]MBB1125251.1 hypothetical protein [Thiospirillum jenense]